MSHSVFYDPRLDWLRILRERPRSARDLALALGSPVSHARTRAIYAELCSMERRGDVQRHRTGGGP